MASPGPIGLFTPTDGSNALDMTDVPYTADQLLQLNDGSLYDPQLGITYPAPGGNPNSSAAGLATLGNPGSIPANVPVGSSASDLSQLANAVGTWGVALTSIFTNRPVAVNAKGQPIGALGSRTVAASSSSTVIILLLIGIGAFALFLHDED